MESPARKCAAHKQTRGSTAQRGYGSAWQRYAKRMIAEHLRTVGHVCFGWQVPSHASDDLTVDHDVGVLCRSCNSRKAALHDRGRAVPHGGDRALPPARARA